MRKIFLLNLLCFVVTIGRFLYYNNRVNQVNIDTLECGCGDNPCPAFTTETGVDLTTPTADGSCVYTIEATCANPAFFLIFNMDLSVVSTGPRTLTCNRGVYQYNFGFASGDVNNLECGCRQNPCSLTTEAGVETTTPVSDANCIYSLDVSCTFPEQQLVFNTPGTVFSSPQTLQCINTITGAYNYETSPPTDSVLTARCQCPANSCQNPYTAFGPEIDVTLSTANDNCNYPIDVTCDDPTYQIIINDATDRIRINAPQTFSCDSTSMKYIYNGVSIDTLQCVPECANPCGRFAAGPEITVSTPIADGNCILSVTATCNTGTMLEVHLQNMQIFLVNSPHTFTCNGGPYWQFVNGADSGDFYLILRCL